MFSWTMKVATFGLSVWGSVAGAQPGTIIVNGDEWALSNPGFFNAPDGSVEQFVANIVDELGPKIHAYSTNFGYTQNSLAQAMERAGAEYSTGMKFEFKLKDLLNFDTIMLGGNFLDPSEVETLHEYVAAGGNVFISAGTGVAKPYTEEGKAWNEFLIDYGIQLEIEFSGFFGNVTAEGDSIFEGVDELYVGNPNAVISGGVCCRENSVFAIWRPAKPKKVSESDLGSSSAGSATGPVEGGSSATE